MVEIFDGSDATLEIPNLAITIDGDIASDVYEISGDQDLVLIDGRITLGIHPRANPTPDNPVIVVVVITGDG